MRWFVIVVCFVFSAILPALVAADDASDDAMEHQKSTRFDVSLSANPRFPVARQEAKLTFRVTSGDASGAAQEATIEVVKTEGQDDHAEDQHGSQPKASDQHEEPAGSGDGMADMEPEAAEGSGDGMADMEPEAAEGSGHGMADLEPEGQEGSGHGMADLEPEEAEGSGHGMADLEPEGQAQQDLMRVSAVTQAPGAYLATLTFPEGGVYHVAFRIGEENTEFMVGVRAKPIAWWFVYGLGLIIVLVAGFVAVIKTAKKEW